MSGVEVLAVASEIYPLIKTGGLADVVGALPAALSAEGVRVRTLVPGYPAVIEALDRSEPAHRWSDLLGGPATALSGRARGLDLFVLDAPHLFDRSGNPYIGPDGGDWPDNAQRFAALSRAGAAIGTGAIAGYQPDVVHIHDWQAGLVPAYLRYGGGGHPKTVATVHNLGFQGKFPAGLLGQLGLPPESYTIDGVEYYGTIGYLKAALQFADRITTVSPNYAAEILGREAGMGLDGLLRARAHALSGIVNGIDVEIWDPARDPSIAKPYDARRLQARAANKAALQERMNLAQDPAVPLFGVVSRLTWQKGLDLLLAALPELLEDGGQLSLVGAGEPGLQEGFRNLGAANPGRVGCFFGYDEKTAHLVQAGSDVVVVPSRYEPCGLTQLCALRYGAVPLVARVGGLADTVIDASEMAMAQGVATGIQFAPVEVHMLQAAIRRAVALFADRGAWARIQRNAMKTDVSWRNPARHYAALFRELIGGRGA